LARLDDIGLVWLLRDRLVVELTETTAAYRCANGSILTYCRRTAPAAPAPEIADAVQSIGKPTPTTEIGKASPAKQIDSAVALYRPATNAMAQIGKPTPAVEITEVTSAAEIDVAAPARIIDAPKPARRKADGANHAETETPRSKKTRPGSSVDGERRRRVDHDVEPLESGKGIFLALAGVAAEQAPIALRNIAGEVLSPADIDEMVAAIDHLIREWDGVKRKIRVNTKDRHQNEGCLSADAANHAEAKTPRSKKSRPDGGGRRQRRRVEDEATSKVSGKVIFLALAAIAADKVRIALRNIRGEEFAQQTKTKWWRQSTTSFASGMRKTKNPGQGAKD
jgi:hypothetical protein